MQREWTTSAVHAYLNGDGAARDLMARGVVNYRALARWMIQTEDWDASEDAVVSALRRFPSESDPPQVTEARRSLSQSQIMSRTDVCSLTLPRSAWVHQKLPLLFELVDPAKGELLRIIEGDQSVTIIFSESKLVQIKKALSGSEILGTIQGLAEYGIIAQKEAGTSGLMILVLNNLSANGVKVVKSLSVGRELMVFVSARDALKAYRVFQTLCNRAKMDFSPPDIWPNVHGR